MQGQLFESVIEMVPVKTIISDHRYQRPINAKKVRDIVKNYTPTSYGVLIVNRRNDGTMVMLDGQHRLEAARMRKDRLVKCEVYHCLTVAEEAMTFIRCNAMRAIPRALDVFRARIFEGDQQAVAINAVISDCGFRLADTQHSRENNIIRAVGALDEIWHHGGEPLLRKVLYIISQAWPHQQRALESKVLRGVMLFHLNFAEQYSLPDLIAKLSTCSVITLCQEAQGTSKFLGGHDATNFAFVILSIYNKGKRSRKLATDAFLKNAKVA